VLSILVGIGLHLLMERTRLGAMIRAASTTCRWRARSASRYRSCSPLVFCLGAGLAGAGGVIGGPIMSAYPGLDADMLPLALIVVILAASAAWSGLSPAASSPASSTPSAWRSFRSSPT